jgi:hypothetical protein
MDMDNEILADLVRSTGDLAGVFEYDGETGYFYLYRTEGTGGAKVIDALHIVSGHADFARNDISIRWDNSETKVALSIRNTIWAVFDCISGEKFGGNYEVDGMPTIPESVRFVKAPH